RNGDFVAEKQIQFRIGIHLGDVMVQPDGDLLGDGVNVAARLEGIAEPGGICLSEDAWRQVRGKIAETFADLGEQTLKNIALPVRVYGVGPGGDGKTKPRDPSAPSSPPRLSIAVLPFANIGGDSEQEYFVDGITESLTTDLSRIAGSFVIARNTAFTYKGKPVDVKQIGRELGVRYVLEGSVQRGGNRLRINVQLIDAESGAHLWAERFERAYGDLFDVQDEIVARLARALDVELTAAEARRAEQSVNPDAMDLVFRALAVFNRGINPTNIDQSRALFEEALKLEPTNVSALTGLAVAVCFAVGSYMTDDRRADLAVAERLAKQALALQSNAALGHLALGFIYSATDRIRDGIAECQHALSLDRNLAHAHAMIGRATIAVGQPEEAEGHIAQAIRLSPRDIYLSTWCNIAGTASFYLGRDDVAVSWFRRAIEADRNYSLAYFYLSAVVAQQGGIDEARRLAQEGLAHDPGFTVRRLFRGGASGGNPLYRSQRQRVYAGMLAAGVPEG
ncbi:MAG TPA: adenylate/guanylate cyclase domain-containing protein, partial [Stellaceae bacterium]|nr:adenylate/guanylate cyclase domain-containing protein [Stellaceae bacterium]